MKRRLNKSANAMRKKGTGKSLSRIKPDNIQVLGSYIITDPKGELHRDPENCLLKRVNYMKRNLVSNSHFKLQFANCDNTENKKRIELHYSQDKVRLTNKRTGKIILTTIKENALNYITLNGYLKAGDYLMEFIY